MRGVEGNRDAFLTGRRTEMVDLGLFKIKTEVFLVLVSVAVFFVQLLLCSKVKNLLIRLIPAMLFFISATCFIVLSYVYYEGWDGLGALVLGLFFALLLLVCALAWVIRAVLKGIRAKWAK